jgi:uncharacterized membrane protein
MKTQVFTVTVTFSGKVSDDDAIKEVAYKIADALRNECDSGGGLAPESSDSYTKEIIVSHDFVSEACTVVNMSGAASKISQS